MLYTRANPARHFALFEDDVQALTSSQFRPERWVERNEWAELPFLHTLEFRFASQRFPLSSRLSFFLPRIALSLRDFELQVTSLQPWRGKWRRILLSPRILLLIEKKTFQDSKTTWSGGKPFSNWPFHRLFWHFLPGFLTKSRVTRVLLLFRNTFVITHGYLEHGKIPWLQRMKEELLANGDHNVILLVRSYPCQFINYLIKKLSLAGLASGV